MNNIKSPNLNFNLLSQNQYQKEITANEAFLTIDSILNNGVIDIVNNLPNNPTSGNLYIVGDNPTDQPEGISGYLAYFYENAWKFLKPHQGCTQWISKFSRLLTFNGQNWITSSNTFNLVTTDTETENSILNAGSVSSTNTIPLAKTQFALPTKIQITTQSNDLTFEIVGKNEYDIAITESVTTTPNLKSITNNRFSSISLIRLTYGTETTNVSIGNTDALLELNEYSSYINLNSDLTVRVPTYFRAEYKIYILNKLKATNSINWEQTINWNNNGNTNANNNNYKIVVTDEKDIMEVL